MNSAYTVIFILLIALGYWYSWKLSNKNAYTYAILALMLLGFALRLFTALDQYLHPWDERYHALVAKNLLHHFFTPTLYDNPALGYDYRSWTAGHFWLHKQPFTLWVMALSIKLFGANELAIRLPSILYTTIGIGLTYSITKYIFNQKTAFIAAFLYAINGLIIEISAGRVATDHVDVCFLFFIQLGIYFSVLSVQKKSFIYPFFIGCCMGIAILTKWLPALIILPVWAVLFYDGKTNRPKQLPNLNKNELHSHPNSLPPFLTHLGIILATALAVALPWQIYIYKQFPNEAHWEAAYNIKHFTQVLDKQGGQWYFFLDIIRINYGELIYLVLIWFGYSIFKNKPFDLKKISLIIWAFLPLLIFSLAKTKMQGYILFTAPCYFMMTAGLYELFGNFTPLKSNSILLNLQKRHTKLFTFSTKTIALLLLALPIRYSIERIKPFQPASNNALWTADLKKLNIDLHQGQNLRPHQEQLENPTQQGVLFNYKAPIEAMFYTDLTVYDELPDSTTIKNLIQQGKTIFVNIDGETPPSIKGVKGIRFLHLTPPN